MRFIASVSLKTGTRPGGGSGSSAGLLAERRADPAGVPGALLGAVASLMLASTSAHDVPAAWHRSFGRANRFLYCIGCQCWHG